MKETPEMYREKDYYDGVFAKDLQWYTDDPEVCQYYPIWSRMVEQIRGPVIDVGCGVGQCAQLITRRGHEFVVGVDFSEVAIQKAIDRNPGLKFVCSDVMLFGFDKYDYSTVFSSETFEHLIDDIAFLERIPWGKRVVLCVPDAHAIGHARHFENIDDTVNRYKSHIDIDYTDQYKLVNITFFIIAGTRRGNRV
jgi:SAM-dependent methyltransferase